MGLLQTTPRGAGDSGAPHEMHNTYRYRGNGGGRPTPARERDAMMNHRLFGWMGALVVLLAAGPLWSQATPSQRTTIAIIDFRNTSGNSDLDYLQNALPEALITQLAESGELSIVERARLQDALGEMQLGMSGVVDQSTAVQIGKAVGANAILVGSFLEIGGVIQLNARLIDVESSQVLIAKTTRGRVGTEIFDLMDELAESIEQQLVGPPEKPAQVAQQEPQQPPAQQTRPEPRREEVSGGGGGGKTLLIVGGLVLVGAGVAAAVLLAGGDDDDDPTSANVEIVIPLKLQGDRP